MENHGGALKSRRAPGGARAVVVLAALLPACLLPLAWCAALLPKGIIPEFVAYHLSLSANLLIAALAYGSLVAIPALVFISLLTWLFRHHPQARKVRTWISRCCWP